MRNTVLAAAVLCLIGFSAEASPLPPSSICGIKGTVEAFDAGTSKVTVQLSERGVAEDRGNNTSCQPVTQPVSAEYTYREEGAFPFAAGTAIEAQTEYTGDEFAQGEVIFNIKAAEETADGEEAKP